MALQWEGREARGERVGAEHSLTDLARFACAGAAQCMAKGRAITDFGAKQKYMAQISDALKHCPYKVWNADPVGLPFSPFARLRPCKQRAACARLRNQPITKNVADRFMAHPLYRVDHSSHPAITLSRRRAQSARQGTLSLRPVTPTICILESNLDLISGVHDRVVRHWRVYA